MQTNWGTAKSFIVERLQADGESSIDFSDTSFEGRFDMRCQLALALFTKAILWLYASKATLTLAADDQDVSLDDPAKCSKPIFSADTIWISGSPIEKLQGLRELNQNYDPTTTTSGSPMGWAQINDYLIRLSHPCPSGLTLTYASGFYSHPKPASDAATLEIPLDHCDILGAFAAVMLRSKVWSESLTLERLKGYSKEASSQMQAIRARQMMRFFQGNHE